MNLFTKTKKWAGSTDFAATCSFCAQGIAYGERAWYCSGLLACEDCFEQFARLELEPFALTLGEEKKYDTL